LPWVRAAPAISRWRRSARLRGGRELRHAGANVFGVMSQRANCDGATDADADLAASSAHDVALLAGHFEHDAHGVGANCATRTSVMAPRAVRSYAARLHGELGTDHIDDDAIRVGQREVRDLGSASTAITSSAPSVPGTSETPVTLAAADIGRVQTHGGRCRSGVWLRAHGGVSRHGVHQGHGEHRGRRLNDHRVLAVVESLVSGSVSCRLNPNSSMEKITAFWRMPETRRRPSVCPTRTRYWACETTSRRMATEFAVRIEGDRGEAQVADQRAQFAACA
jgi:hypothetical protein